MGAIESRITDLGLTLPEVATPLAAYVPAVVTGDLVFTSGQLPTVSGKLVAEGRVSDTPGAGLVDVATAKQAAAVSALNALAAVKSVIGDLDRIEQIVKLTGFVACEPAFTSHPSVVNGASELLGEIFGERAKHARSSVGMASLPLNAPVEIELVVRFR